MMLGRLAKLFLVTGLTLLSALPAVAQQNAGTTLRFVPHADLSILDPYFTGVYITRNYGYMVYDTLFAMDSAFRPQPQMVDTWKVSDDKLTYTLTLRDGLKFHDGQPVRVADVVASRRLFAASAALGALANGALLLAPDYGAALGCRFAAPLQASGEADLVIHASGSPDGLATALAIAGFEATVVEMSWYGTRSVPLPLGGAFHSRRLTLRSSQVGTVPASRRERWSRRRRLALALALLRDPVFDLLLSGESEFAAMPDLLPRLAASAARSFSSAQCWVA